MNKSKHTSVFLDEAVQALSVVAGGKYIDATFGEGGHSRLIQSMGGTVLGIDADKNQVLKQEENTIHVVQGNFAHIEEIAQEAHMIPVDGVLFDFGLSMEQLDKSRRGFSYKRYDEPLDMRIGESDITAQEILEKTNAEELTELIVKYSEDLQSEKIARAIIRHRKENQIATVGDLISIINKTLETIGIYHEKTKSQVYARIFQALRIVVNNEFESIKKGLDGALKILKPGGRMVIISFHSLEDRIVKLFGREHASVLKDEKIHVERKRKLQNFERSAQLRVFIKNI